MNASDARTEYVSRLRQLAAQVESEDREAHASLLLDLAEAVAQGRHLDATTMYYGLPLPLYGSVGKAPPNAS